MPTWPGMAIACGKNKNSKKCKKYLDKIEVMDYIKTMKNETIKRYNEMFAKFNAGKITEKEWQAFCFVVLGEVMEENKDVFIRLKNR